MSRPTLPVPAPVTARNLHDIAAFVAPHNRERVRVGKQIDERGNVVSCNTNERSRVVPEILPAAKQWWRCVARCVEFSALVVVTVFIQTWWWLAHSSLSQFSYRHGGGTQELSPTPAVVSSEFANEQV